MEKPFKIQGSQDLHPCQESRARIPALCGPGRKGVGVEQRRHYSSWCRGHQPSLQAGLLVGLLTQNKYLAPTVWLGNKASKKHTFMVNKPKEKKTSREAKKEPMSQARQGARTQKESRARPERRHRSQGGHTGNSHAREQRQPLSGDMEIRSPGIESWQRCLAHSGNLGKAALLPGPLLAPLTCTMRRLF